MLDPARRTRLRPATAAHFPGETLFARVARVVCEADCLPRKELYESWEVARRVRRHFRGGRVVDLACGHGLVAHLMLLLDDSSPRALEIDTRFPPSAALVSAALCRAWPRLEGRIAFAECSLDEVALDAGDLVIGTHACGALTDRILARAVAARARVAVLPCCHDETICDTGRLEGWMDAATAIDVTRAARLAGAGYEVRTLLIPAEITPKRRLLLGEPPQGGLA